MSRSEELRVAIAQINTTVGAIEENASRIIDVVIKARDDFGADCVVFPELVLTGYPPEDILLREELYQRLDVAMEKIMHKAIGIDVLVGHPTLSPDNLIYNAVTHLSRGQVQSTYAKRVLPNYGVFDEARYFTPSISVPVFEIEDVMVGIMVCEDGWSPSVAADAVEAGAQLLIQVNASPYRMGKHEERLSVARERVQQTNLSLVNVQLVGGQDALVFDGHSFVMNSEGVVTHELPPFVEQLACVVFENETGVWEPAAPEKLTEYAEEAYLYDALVLGLRDYVEKNGFPGVLLGLSGGIDSALTMAIAVDALGPLEVTAVLMPSQYTQDMSIEDALEMTEILDVRHHMISITPTYKAFKESLAHAFNGMPEDETEENLQARCRGVLLMALSNKSGNLLLTTGNKSEMAVGYATLYGDMAGGFSVLKDVYKTQVYRLAEYRNRLSEVIPERILLRAPSAELRDDQMDQDTLPDYEVLDSILHHYIEEDMDAISIAAKGFSMELVNDIIAMVKRNEYKRRQSVIGVKVSLRSFDKDWRYPITSHF